MKQARILVVDDDPAIARLLSEIISSRGHEPHIVRSGGNFLEAMASLRPDLAVLDVMLPDMSGLEALRQLRERGDATRVLVVTTLTDNSYRKRAEQLGASFMTKPFTPKQLARALELLLAPGSPGAA